MVRPSPNDVADVSEIEATLANPSAGPGFSGVGTWIMMGHGNGYVCFPGMDGHITYAADSGRIASLFGNIVKTSTGSAGAGPKRRYLYGKRLQCAQLYGCRTSTGEWARRLGTPPEVDQETQLNGKSVFFGYKDVSYLNKTCRDFITHMAAWWGGPGALDTSFEAVYDSGINRYPKVKKWQPEIFGWRKLTYRGDQQ